MLILYNYKKLNLRAKKYSINYKKKKLEIKYTLILDKCYV